MGSALGTPRAWGWRVGSALVAVALSPGLPALAAWRGRRGLVFEAVELGLYLLAVGAARGASPTGFWLGLGLIVAWRIVAAVDAFRAPAAPRKMHWALLVGISLGLLFGKEGVALLLRKNGVEAFQSPSQSMAPTLLAGERFFVGKHPGELQRGEVVAFLRPDQPRTPYVKRIVGVGGDVVAMAGDQLTVNGARVPRRRIDDECPVPVEGGACAIWEETLAGRSYRVLETTFGAPSDEAWTVTVPAGSYFVLGDHRDNSNDSRHFGSVPAAGIFGVATFIWWSAGEAGVRLDRMNRRLR